MNISKKTFAFVVIIIVFHATPSFAQWVQTNGPSGGGVSCFATIGTNLFAGTSGGGVSLSTNNGASWTAVNTGLMYINVQVLAVSGTNLFAGTGTGGVFLSTNNGASWTEVNTGLPQYTKVDALAASGTNLFASTDKGFFRRPLAEMVTGVESINNTIPTAFTLMQNYPNPFNPSTTIRFELLRGSQVTLKMYDVFGREIAALVDEKLTAGVYGVTWDAIGVTSGAYFYRLQAGSFSETKKLLLLR